MPPAPSSPASPQQTGARQTAQRLRPFGTTIFSEMTALAQEHGAINLSQGTPDFDRPPEVIEAAAAALRQGNLNQYMRSAGHPLLVTAIAERYHQLYGLELDPMREVSVTCGATEALAAALLGLLNPGDEVILIEPFYDSYPALVALAGAVPRFLQLPFPDFTLDLDALAALITPRTRLILLNNPHNPTGKVFRPDELAALAELCQRHDLLVLSDEVYEHLVFDDARHIALATLPGMHERTLTISSTGKTFSFTGWKIGWTAGPAPLVAAAQAAHQFLTFCVPGALQVAMAQALRQFTGDYLATFRADYTARRDLLVRGLQDAGFEVAVPAGTYMVLTGYSRLWSGDDRSFAHHLVAHCGIATVPTSVFYHQPPQPAPLRFAFCKRLETLQAAVDTLRQLRLAEARSTCA